MTSTLSQLKHQFLSNICYPQSKQIEVTEIQQEIKQTPYQIAQQNIIDEEKINQDLLQEQLNIQKLQYEEQLQQTITIVQNNFQNKEEYITYLEAQLQRHLKSESQLKIQLASKNKSIAALVNESIAEHMSTIQQLNLENQSLNTMVEEQKDQIKFLKIQNKTLVKEKQELDASLISAEQNITQSSVTVQDYNKYLDQTISSLQENQFKEFTVFQNIYQEVKHEKESLENSLIVKEEKIENLNTQIQEIKQQNNTFKSYNKHLEREFEESKQSQILVKDELLQLKSANNSELIKKIQTLECTIEELKHSQIQ